MHACMHAQASRLSSNSLQRMADTHFLQTPREESRGRHELTLLLARVDACNACDLQAARIWRIRRRLQA